MSNSEIAQRSTRGSFALFIGNLLSALIAAVVLIIVARLLGANLYGEYSLVILIPSILLNFLGLGVSSGVTRYAAYHLARNEPQVARRVTVNGTVFLLAFGAFLTIVEYAGSGLFSTYLLHRPDLSGLVQVASLLLLGQTVFTAAMAGLLGWSVMGQMGVSYVVQSSARLVLTVGLVLAGFGVGGVIAGYSGGVAIAGISAAAVLWNRMKGVRGADGGEGGLVRWWRTFSSDISAMLRFAVPLFVGGLALTLSSQYLLIVLAAISTTNAPIGYFQAASAVTIAISVSSSAVTQALFPAFAHLTGAEGDTALAFKYATKYMGFVIVPIIFLLMVSSSPVIAILYSPSYSPAGPYLFLFSLTNIALLIGYGVLPSYFSGVGRPRLYMAYSLANAATQFALAPLLGSYAGLGIPGLLYSSLISNLVGAVVGLALAAKYLHARIDMKGAASILVASAASFLVVFAMNAAAAGVGNAPLLAADIFFFAVAYLTLAPLVCAIGADDLRRLEVAMGGMGRFRNVLGVLLRYESLILRLVHAT